MESNRALDKDLSALAQMSDNELDELLKLDDSIEPSSSKFHITMQPPAPAQEDHKALGSVQLSNNDRKCRKSIRHVPPSPQHRRRSYEIESMNSVEIISQDIDIVELDNTKTSPDSKDTHAKAGNRSPDCLQHSPTATNFDLYGDEQFDIATLDFDLEGLDAIERQLDSQGVQEPPGKEHLTTNQKFQTQFEFVKHEVRQAQQDVSASCPIPQQFARPSCKEMARPIPTPVSSESAQNNPMKYLTLEFSKSNTDHRTLLSAPHGMETNKATPHADTLQGRVSPMDRLDFTDARLTPLHKVEPTSLSNADITNGNSSKSDASNTGGGDASMIPLSVQQLYTLIKSQFSDFAFVYALSAQLCQNRVPMDCFVCLKMGLLLSLASGGGCTDRPPIPIIAIGTDTYMIDYLMSTIGQLAARFIGPTDEFKAPSSSGCRNQQWLEADPTLLAKGGVYYVGDWARLRIQRADKIFKDIECGRIAVEKCPQSYPLQTAIWTHWRSFSYNAKEQQMFNKFVKIFGIPLHVDDDNHEGLVNYILEQASVKMFESTEDHLSINDDDMRLFLAVINKRTVEISDEANMLLRKYFVASRVERPDCLTQQAFVILKQFAESFAKLSLRYEVQVIDVISAIFMCESFIQQIFGAGQHPPPKFEAYNFVGAVDNHLNEFHGWLHSYIEKFYNQD